MAMEGFPYGPPGSPEYAAYQAEWHRRKRKNDPAWAKENSRKIRAKQIANPLQHALWLYKGSSRRRGLECKLLDEEFARLLKQDCFYCGAAPNPINGIDRIDNTRGYVEGNVTTACRTCNMAKAEMSLDEFKAWIRRVAQRMEG